MILRLSAFLLLAWILSFSAHVNVSAGELAAPTAQSQSTNADNIRELHMLMQQSGLVELRSAFNGTYGTSLLLDQNSLTYYTASFQRKNFIRVFKNRSEENAENHYRQLSEWSEVQGKEEIANMKKIARQYRDARVSERQNVLNAPASH